MSNRAAKVQQEFVREPKRYSISEWLLVLVIALFGLAIAMLVFWH